MKTYVEPSKELWTEITKRPEVNAAELFETVEQIFREVRSEKDEALKKYTHYFDRADLTELLVKPEEIQAAVSEVSSELKSAMELAKANIEAFHSSQLSQKQVVETTKGVKCWQENRGIERIGIYIPGGTAPLFSTVLMLALPAKLAGCEEVVLCTPPAKDGSINNAILYAAQLCGVDIIVKAGGIQAIAAMTYGTESVPKVYKIFGPGNQYVTAAKQYAQLQGVAIDMPAGPSELMVVADDTANPEWIVSDLLSQAEHGSDSQVVCLLSSVNLLEAIKTELKEQLELLPRAEVAREALKYAQVVVLAERKDRIKLINEYAPEHLIINTSDYEQYIPEIRNAGSVFLGANTPESAGDYASGTNHTLPTNGFAKAYSGVNIDAFVKKITFQEITEEGLERIGPSIEVMAEAEGLKAHAMAVSRRIYKEVEL